MTSPQPDSVKFTCTHCGNCCTGAPGAVRISEDEIDTLAAHLGTPREKLIGPILRPYPHHLATDDSPNTGDAPRWSLTENPDASCIFYKDNRCTIYPARPAQCRTYPFWLKNLRNPEAWQRTARQCPGIGQGDLHTPEQILATLQTAPL